MRTAVILDPGELFTLTKGGRLELLVHGAHGPIGVMLVGTRNVAPTPENRFDLDPAEAAAMGKLQKKRKRQRVWAAAKRASLQTSPPKSSALLSATEVAQRLGLDNATVHLAKNNNKLPVGKHITKLSGKGGGPHYLFRWSDVEKWRASVRPRR